MATNFFFHNYQNSQEQLLIEDLIIESIRIYGLDMYYVPRTTVSYDNILNEDSNRSYGKAIPIELYIKNVDGFGGDGDFLSKFNIEIRDQITFTVARRVFEEEITTELDTLIRPREGDLIYFPLNKKIFEIRFVEHEAIFYQMGALQTYDLKCELFEYSNERMDTGIADIDSLEYRYGQTFNIYVTDTTDAFIKGETIQQTTPDGYTMSAELFSIAANTFTSNAYTLEIGRFSNGGDPLYTTFIANTAVVGANSAASGTVQGEPTEQSDGDNAYFESEGAAIIDFTERDPFSEGGTF